MDSGEFFTELAVGNLQPAPSVREAQGQAPGQEAERQARRRRRADAEEDDIPGDQSAAEDAGNHGHQLDRLA